MSKHAHIVDLREMGNINPIANPVAWAISSVVFWLVQNVYGGVRVEIEDFPEMSSPVLFAMNHSHYFDFMQSRRSMFKQKGVMTTTFVKVRAFQNRLEGAYIKSMGNIPTISRGYLISADFAQLHQRKLDEDEYRALRNHINMGEPLPDEPCYRALQETPRDMLGFGFDPKQMTYREAVGACYSKAMATTIALARKVTDAGHCMHIYPEGLFSSRLSRGRIGAVQFALALDLPIVPVGFSGMNQLFPRKKMVPNKRGVLKMRFGKPYRLDRSRFEGFTPFSPADEIQFQDALKDETHQLMNRINDLLDEECSWGSDLAGDGFKGVARFFE